MESGDPVSLVMRYSNFVKRYCCVDFSSPLFSPESSTYLLSTLRQLESGSNFFIPCAMDCGLCPRSFLVYDAILAYDESLDSR